ncbi:dehydrodolichyl diphosphate synthase 6 isoform X2 [Jatropha curcas]|uniref:dehydrodolichyl diphosphate synthase 6 isoform X2 n=1 Tax=Jatropha curcas TaxID=180498 RepID=UPI0009D78049|nr:dehydrodolichyl diphosphate synthase 6 isoform X2 [Jatropha curcas]
MGFNEMTKSSSRVAELFGNLGGLLRICLFQIVSMGPIPSHFAFIMDGNRRYAKKGNLKLGAGHQAGFESLISILMYCYELGVKYVTIYAFSIDNFKRRPDEVKDLMDLMLEKIDEMLKEESMAKQYGIRVYFKVQDSCKNKWEEIQPLSFWKATNGGIQEIDDCKKMNGVTPHGFQEFRKDEVDGSQATTTSATCSGLIRGVGGVDTEHSMVMHAVHTSYEDQALMANRIGHGVSPIEESEKMQGECSMIKLVDIEKYMYMAVAPEPDILIQSSGETRLSNFLLWQSTNCLLYSPDALWPEIGS